MASNRSKRELKVKVTLEALNIIAYPDRMSTTATANNPAVSVPGAPQAQSTNISSPQRISAFGFGKVLPPNPNIGSPYNTFVYGFLTNTTGFDLISPPNDSKILAFPFSSKYSQYLNTYQGHQQVFTFSDGAQSSQIAPSPFIPSRKITAISQIPKTTSYNIWGLSDSNGNFITDNITYYRGQNPAFSDAWIYGTISQSLDNEDQAVINIDSTNGKTVFMRRMFNIRQDSLYETESTIVYPSNSGISPTKYNVKNGLKIINPRENCGFMMTVNISEISGTNSETNSSRGLVIKWGNLDSYRSTSTTSNYIEYYELFLSTSEDPKLRFWHPINQSFSEVRLSGNPLSSGLNKIYVHYAGNNLLIGFNEDILNWNSLGSVEPKENEQYIVLHHLTPGGRLDPKIDSGVAIELSNIKCDFKYSGIAFKNYVTSSKETQVDFFDTAADELKKQDRHKFVISADFLKKISQTSRLSDYFYGKSLRLQERLRGTHEYVKKQSTKYFFDSDLLTENVDRDLASISFARDWRLASPFDSDYNNSESWEIKLKLLTPSYEQVLPTDFLTASNTELSIIFDSPVYSPVFFELNTLNMQTDDINLNSSQGLAQSQGDILASAMAGNPFTFTENNAESITGENGAINTPIFPFVWGDITDLVDTKTISVTHQIDADGFGKSNASITLNNLIFSNRGVNILNMIENNLTVVKIQAGYNDQRELPTYFEGVITSTNSDRSPLGSTHICSCEDWFNYVLSNSRSYSTFSLQGVRVRDRIKIALRLSGLERYYQLIDQDGVPLLEDPSLYPNNDINKPNISFATAMSFRQGNGTSKSAAQNLSETIDTDNILKTFVVESLQFILDDKAIACIYGNNRKEYLQERTTISDTTVLAPRIRKVIAENRFLPQSISNFTIPLFSGRVRDSFRFLVKPSRVAETPTQNNVNNYVSGLLDDYFSTSPKKFDIENFHGMIISGLETTSNQSGLYEGVYMLAVGLGSVPILHTRTSDSYFIGDPSSSSTPTTDDAGLYGLANNRTVNILVFDGTNIIDIDDNVLDILNSRDINKESDFLRRGEFGFGYVGFRKRFFDDLRQTYIQTQSDLVNRGNLWAQYIRRVVQNVRFSAFVSKPLEHYNNFHIQHFDTTVQESNIFKSIFDEFKDFLYSRVTYNIDKGNNIITAEINGSVVPKFGTNLTDSPAEGNDKSP